MDFAPSTISYDQKVKVMAIMAEAICLLKVAMKQVEDLEVTLWQILEMPDPWLLCAGQALHGVRRSP